MFWLILVVKRMKVVVFCSEIKVGEEFVVRFYCFDDCEWFFEVYGFYFMIIQISVIVNVIF